ncbi:MAG: branched-chain amino acid aminotransferase [Christensenellaceae bacterium]|jgi:branched-chain amino acid aminotransferase|nr:branched-chain amino acid aminotransferase [Christensenellaceae bacterium]
MKIARTKQLKEKPDYSKLGFGKYFTDHMIVMDYVNGKWNELEIVAYSQFSFDPSMNAMHYGQGIFDGLKAYANTNGEIQLFRPTENLNRFNRSAARLCMPEIDIDVVLRGLKKLIDIDREWLPKEDGTSIYIRPTMLGTEEALGVHPSKSYRFFIILSPVASYYANGLEPVKILVEEKLVRAVTGGTGNIKCMGNYAASLLAGARANEKGYAQVLWLDAYEHKYAEEVGAMNIFFVIDGIVKTPQLLGSILPGITRDSVIALLKDEGVPIEETRISIEEVVSAHKNGKLDEVFGSGTAAVISPVGVLGYNGVDLIINNNKMGKLSAGLYKKLTDIQYGRSQDKFGWIEKI